MFRDRLSPVGLWPRSWRSRFLLSVVAVVGAMLVAGILFTLPTPQPWGVPGHWHLIFDSEFDGHALPADWHTGWFGSGITEPVNKAENSCYSPANVTFPGDGTLHLSVTRASHTCGSITHPFTGALISTNPGTNDGRGFQYAHGVLQARVYLPADGNKLADWPAIWAVSQPGQPYGEDDVVEGLSGQACWHFHSAAGATGDCATHFTPGWHTVASAWRNGSVTFYYDGKPIAELTSGITSGPMYVVLDLTSQPGSSIPATLRVKYLKVWQAGF